MNVGTTTNNVAIQPGCYVIRLGEFSQPEALPVPSEREALTIEHEGASSEL